MFVRERLRPTIARCHPHTRAVAPDKHRACMRSGVSFNELHTRKPDCSLPCSCYNRIHAVLPCSHHGLMYHGLPFLKDKEPNMSLSALQYCPALEFCNTANSDGSLWCSLTGDILPTKRKYIVWRFAGQRLTHWKDFRALALPGFFLSTTLASLVRRPAGLRSSLSFGSKHWRALLMPCLMACMRKLHIA